MFVKICGITSAEALDAAVAAGADAVGFVFAPSPREITPQRAAALAATLPRGVKRVAVTRHPTPEHMLRVCEMFAPDWLQTDAEDLSVLDLPQNVCALPVYRDGGAKPKTPGRLLFEGPVSGSGRHGRLGPSARSRHACGADPCGRPQQGQRRGRHSLRATLGCGRVERSGAAARRERPRDDTRVRGPRAGTGGTMKNPEHADRDALFAALLARRLPDENGRFGPFGGRYVPETLMPAIERLAEGVATILPSADFQRRLASELTSWAGRPTALTHAHTLSKRWDADVWLKREDLAHTGAHKINNTIGQALLAKELGAKRIVAETGAGQHGVASAAACARIGLPCTVYMGEVDVARQAPNVDRMRRLGARVVPVTSGDRTLRAAIDEAIRDWVSDPVATYYLLGSAIGPHPYPLLVRELQSVIGREARAQIIAAAGLPDAAFACVGGGSNSIGLFPRLSRGSKRRAVRRGGRGPRHRSRRAFRNAVGRPPRRAARHLLEAPVR